MSSYDEEVYTQMAIKVLEHDIAFLAHRYHIPGYDYQDLCQELRMVLWTKLQKFDHSKEIKVRTWANTVMKNHLRNLLRDANRKKRGGNCETIPLVDGLDHYEQSLNEILDFLIEYDLDLDDFI